MAQGPKSSTRKHSRIQAVFKVSYRDVEGLVDYTENVSEGGVFIATEQELQPGEEILFELSFPGLVKPIRMSGEVVWRRARESLDASEAPGVGVHLHFGSELERLWLRDLLHRFASDTDECNGAHRPSRAYVILLAEDNPMTLSLFTDALHSWSGSDLDPLKVLQAETSESAWSTLQSQHVDLLIIEWRLCHHGTFDLLADLRSQADEHKRQMPVIVVGASMGEQDLAVRAGADVFLRRPVPAKGLLQTVRSLVTTSR